MQFSIVYPEHKCVECGREYGLELHHIFYGTANRSLSDRDGLYCYLCYKHHRSFLYGVHGGNRELDLKLKKDAQAAYMTVYHKTKQDFITRYGKNYLEEE